MCGRERKRKIAKGRDLKREMTLIHCVFSVPDLAHIAVKEHACQAAKIEDSLRRMWRRQNALLCLLMFLISLSPYLSFPALCACVSVVLEDDELCHIFSLFSIPPFSLLVSLSPMLLFLHSQVASRVSVGFVGAHARWRDTVTDLIAEREIRAERGDGDKGGLDARVKKFRVAFGFLYSVPNELH